MTVFVEQMPSLVGRFLMRCKGAFLTVNLSNDTLDGLINYVCKYAQ